MLSTHAHRMEFIFPNFTGKMQTDGIYPLPVCRWSKIRGLGDIPDGFVTLRETLAGWRNGQRGILTSSTWGIAKLCISGGLTPCTRTCLGLSGWKAAWCPDGQQDDHDLGKHPYMKMLREVILHLFLALVVQQLQFCVQFLLTSTILWSTPKILLAE